MEDNYLETLYTGGGAQHQAYFKNAHHKIKKGKHNDPKNAASLPVFYYWQWRTKLTADTAADTEVDFTADTTMRYKVGAAELTVWLNRALLVKDVDYTEVGAGASSSGKILALKKGVGKTDEVVWIVRSDSTAAGTDQVASWKVFPPWDQFVPSTTAASAARIPLQPPTGCSSRTSPPLPVESTTRSIRKEHLR